MAGQSNDHTTDEQRSRGDEFDTIQRQIAGVGDARISLLSEAQEAQSPKGQDRQRRRREVHSLNALQRMLLIQEYAPLHAAFIDFLNDAKHQTHSALELAELALNDLLSSAARLPDGRSVFRNVDGHIVGVDGKEISSDRINEVIWPNDAPTYEEYCVARDRVEALKTLEVDLADMQARAEDPDNPLSAEEIKEMQEEIETQTKDLLHGEMHNETGASLPKKTVSSIAVPDLGF